MMTPMTWSRRPAKWLYITAIFELALAGVFLAIGAFVPVARGGMWLTAGILGLVGLGLLMWANRMSRGLAEADRLREVGLQGQARLVNAEQTGVSMNDNPLVNMELEVTLPGRPPYRVHHREWVPLLRLGTLGIGGSFPVRVDPQDPSKVLIDWTGSIGAWPPAAAVTDVAASTSGQAGTDVSGIVGAALAGMGIAAAAGGGQVTQGQSVQVNLSHQEAIAQQLLSTGIPGQATVTAIQDTGVAVRGQRLLVMDLIVNAPGKPPQNVKHAATVPEASAPKVVQGATLPVRVNAGNPAEFAIDWAKA